MKVKELVSELLSLDQEMDVTVLEDSFRKFKPLVTFDNIIVSEITTLDFKGRIVEEIISDKNGTFVKTPTVKSVLIS